MRLKNSDPLLTAANVIVVLSQIAIIFGGVMLAIGVGALLTVGGSELAKERKAAALVRDAIMMALDGDDSFKAGYNKALRDVVGLVDNISEIKVIAINGKYLADIVAEQVDELKMN